MQKPEDGKPEPIRTSCSFVMSSLDPIDGNWQLDLPSDPALYFLALPVLFSHEFKVFVNFRAADSPRVRAFHEACKKRLPTTAISYSGFAVTQENAAHMAEQAHLLTVPDLRWFEVEMPAEDHFTMILYARHDTAKLCLPYDYSKRQAAKLATAMGVGYRRESRRGFESHRWSINKIGDVRALLCAVAPLLDEQGTLLLPYEDTLSESLKVMALPGVHMPVVLPGACWPASELRVPLKSVYVPVLAAFLNASRSQRQGHLYFEIELARKPVLRYFVSPGMGIEGVASVYEVLGEKRVHALAEKLGVEYETNPEYPGLHMYGSCPDPLEWHHKLLICLMLPLTCLHWLYWRIKAPGVRVSMLPRQARPMIFHTTDDEQEE